MSSPRLDSESLAKMFDLIAQRDPSVVALFETDEFARLSQLVYAALCEREGARERVDRIMTDAARAMAPLIAAERQGENVGGVMDFRMQSPRLDSESVEGASEHAQQIVRNHVVALALSRLGADPSDAERAVLDYIASLESKVAQAGRQRETDRLLWDSSIKGAWAALKDAQSERDEARAALSSEQALHAAWRKRTAETEEDARALAAALLRYGKHRSNDKGWCGPVTCNCGWADAKAIAERYPAIPGRLDSPVPVESTPNTENE